jgi:hypothetical protein
MEKMGYPVIGHNIAVVKSIEMYRASGVGLKVLTLGILSNRESVGQLNDYILFNGKFVAG